MPDVTFHENINGKLSPDTVFFPMIFPLFQDKLPYYGQHYDFYKAVTGQDANGIATQSKEHQFKAQVYDFFYSCLSDLPAHLLYLHYGKEPAEVCRLICERLKIKMSTRIAVVFFTKNLALEPREVVFRS